MHTGQNFIAPENSLPQLGQVRWNSVLMALTALQPQPEPKIKPRATEWCEIGRHGHWQTVVPFHKPKACSLTLAPQIEFRNKIPTVGALPRPVLICGWRDFSEVQVLFTAFRHASYGFSRSFAPLGLKNRPRFVFA
jgi:hypothetical protein